MNIERWLYDPGVIIGVIGVLFAYYFHRKTIRVKVLAIAYTNPIPLILPMKEISVSYLGTTQTALSRVFVLLWNKGTSAIESSDFIEPITLQGEESILLLKIYDKDGAATAAVNLDNKTISVSLLRPGEALIVQIDAAIDAFKPDLSVAMKSSDMSVFLRMDRDIIPFLAAGSLAASTMASIMLVGGSHPEWIPTNELVAAVMSLVTPLLVGVAAYFLIRKIIFGGTSVALRFFQMQRGVSTALGTWELLRKQIEGATQRSDSIYR